MKFPYGTILPEIPKEFTPPEMWPEYGYLADPAPWCKREQLQDNPVVIRWSLWPLCFEQYVGDNEPDIARASNGALVYNRFVLWRRMRDNSTPKGWKRGFGVWRVDGYQLLTQEDDFVKRWNKNARRDLRMWEENHANHTHFIEEITLEEYAAAYKESLIAKKENLDRLRTLERKWCIQTVRQHTILYGVRRKSDGKIVGGSAVIFSPTFKSSTHVAPFILSEGRTIFAATALVHAWFKESLRRGCPTVMTINFYYPGQPKGWKGFSEFKSHFGYEYAAYPPVLWRFVRGKLW